MAKSSTSFAKDKQPTKGRGKSKRNIVLEALKEQGLLGLRKNSSNETAEKAFFGEVAKAALDPEDSRSGLCLKLLSDKGWASIKPSNELVVFDFDKDAPSHVQAVQVMNAASTGKIPPDIANLFIQSIKAIIDIEEYTSLKARIMEIEKSLGVDNG